MKKIFLTLTIILIYLFALAHILSAKTADSSAVMANDYFAKINIDKLIIKKIVIRRILSRYDSPLLGSTDSFVSTCVYYNLDCYLLPSIAGLESTFGKFIYPNSYNPFGWGGGYIMFTSWDNAIFKVGSGLRENYLNNGADTLEEIGSIYAESKTWASRVNHLMNTFAKEEEKIDSILTGNGVKL